MTDYEMVGNLRRILTHLEKEGIGQKEQRLKRIYDLLNATSVSIQPGTSLHNENNNKK